MLLAQVAPPSVIVTAAHCIDDGGPVEFSAYFGNDLEADGGTTITVADKYRNPGWTGSLSGGHDVGLLRLAFPADLTLPRPISVEPLDDHVGESVRIVGFGISDAATGTIDGKKRTGAQSITVMKGDFFESVDDTVALCSGDSGGPAFWTQSDVEYLAGINSYAFGDCDVTLGSGFTHVARFAEDFILPWIADNDPVCGEDGLCGRLGCTDDPDCLPCGPDGTCATDCPLPDRDCPTSGLGEICQADSQCESGLCVFWRDDLSSHFCSEPCELGGASCPDGMSCQTVQPFGAVCYYDDAPPGVLGDPCQEATECGSYLCVESRCVRPCDLPAGDLCPEAFRCESHDDTSYYCFGDQATDDGGCASGGGGGGALAIALLLLSASAIRPRGWTRR